MDADDAAEEWREIPGYDGYEASSLGRVRSVDRWVEVEGNHGRRFYRGRVLRPRRNKYGLLAVQPGRKHPHPYLWLSRAIALAFHGEPPSADHVATHLRDCDDDRPGNLIWATEAEKVEILQKRQPWQAYLKRCRSEVSV
jgi:hypothetical protein